MIFLKDNEIFFKEISGLLFFIFVILNFFITVIYFNTLVAVTFLMLSFI